MFFREEIDSIGKELLQDELIKDISESLSRLIHKISETIEIISKTLLTGLSSLLDYLNEVKTLVIIIFPVIFYGSSINRFYLFINN